MKQIAAVMYDLAERAYTLEKDNLQSSTGSLLFKKDMLGLMIHYITFNLDIEHNSRLLRIIAMCLNSNMSLQERDDFYNEFNVSQNMINSFGEMANEGWPEALPLNQDFESVDVGLLRQRLIAQVNFDAGKMRSKFITVAPGKEMVYIGKWMESRDFFDDPEPDVADYPLLSIDIGKTYNGQTITTLEEAATLIQAMYMQWKEWAKLIEEASSTAIATLKNTEVVDVNELLAAADINWQQVIPALFPALPAPEPEPEPEPEGE